MPVQAPKLSEDPAADSKVLTDVPPAADARGKNGIDEALLKAFIQEVEDESQKMADIDANARKAKQPHVDHIKTILKKAAEKGISKAPLKAALRKRHHLRAADSVDNSLNDNEKALYAQIQQLSGDMPLWNDLEGEDDGSDKE